MSALTLTLAAAIHLATGLVFLLLGYRLSRRPYPEGARGPGQAFAALWILFGAQSIQLALDSLMGALDAATVPIMAALYHTEILLLAAQVWALAFYVLFLISGDTSFNTCSSGSAAPST